VNHSAATSTQPSTFPFCTTNTRSHLDATLVDKGRHTRLFNQQ
jgi:hypothetical protein